MQPEDFRVEELPLYEPQDEGQHLYVRLTKRETTTRNVRIALAKLFGVGERDVGVAGLKDKYAITTQTFSVNVGHHKADFLDSARARIEEATGHTVEWTRFHKNKLKLGHLLGNRFVITIREPSVPVQQAVQQINAIMAVLAERGIPNYFGPQRFGPHGANVARGYEVIARKKFIRDVWARRFMAAAFQSHLCNQYLARRVNDGLFDRLLLGDIAKKYETGGLFDVEDLEAEQIRYAAREISFTAPIFGPKMRLAGEQAGDLEKQILESSGVTLEQLAKARLDGTRRLGRLLIPDLQLDPVDEHADPESITIRFYLPKGAYATTVLREIMKVDLAHVPEDGNDNV